MKPTIVWLREDLRVADNPALTEAVKLGAPVVAVFVLDEVSQGIRPLGAASKWWLHHSLESLSADLKRLGFEFILKRGAAEEVINALADQLSAGAVLWNRRYSLPERESDAQLKTSLRAAGVNCQSYQASLLYEPWTIETGAGKPYSVFTPFYKACLTKLTPRFPLPEADGRGRPSVPHEGIFSDELAEWNLLPHSPDWAKGLRERWQPGAVGAHKRLLEFLEHGVEHYQEGRNFPAKPHTSELSAHLRWGEVSPFQIWHETELVVQARPELRQPADAFIREVIWREFSYHLLFHWPSLATENFNKRFDSFPWKSLNEEHFTAWKEGRTGIPLVDAGMRELWHTGFMHNRVRMVVASFLTKNLMIDWREGERWFWDTLVDADPANNAASWQWVAGCGADAAPYFRIFNPELQAKKFDPDHEYIARWVPEAVSADLAIEQQYSPIIDLYESRNLALDAYKSMPTPS
jgi:deoxyribodipyrimidine photo-lyase